MKKERLLELAGIINEAKYAGWWTGQPAFVVTVIDANSDAGGWAEVAGPFATMDEARKFAEYCQNRYDEGDNAPDRGSQGPYDFEWGFEKIDAPGDFVQRFDTYFEPHPYDD